VIHSKLLQQVVLRLLQAIPTLVGVAILIFVLVRVVPGNPIAMMVAPGASEADIAQLRSLYGLDKSIPAQFVVWAGDVLTGHVGTSIGLRQDVLGVVLPRLPATLELTGLALVMAILLGTSLAVIGVRQHGRAGEAIIDAVTGFGLSVPDFVWALLAILALGVLVPILPISGRMDPTVSLSLTTPFYLAEAIVRLDGRLALDLLRHMLLPAAALALPLASMIARVLKASLHEEMRQDYVLLARAKGFSPRRIILGEALRNAAIPAVSLTGVQFTFLIGGAVLIEKIFAYPGIGNLAVDAVINRDLPLIQGLILVFAVLFIVVNIGLDILYVALNPKLRHG
jgi:ABC-type dipeptide/oligopeptide/nickel transport system permease component